MQKLTDEFVLNALNDHEKKKWYQKLFTPFPDELGKYSAKIVGNKLADLVISGHLKLKRGDVVLTLKGYEKISKKHLTLVKS